MGGTIVVESLPNVGTTFKFSIHSQLNHQQIEPAVPHHLIGYEGKKVLLVDENTTNINVLKEQLELWKLSVTFALSGKEALEILDLQNSFDLVIVDMQMPDMNGLQLASLIKIKLARLPIILVSSIGDETKRKYPDLFAAVVTKPVKQLQLLQDISASLKGANPSTIIVDDKQKYVLSADFASKFPLNILLAEDNPVNQKLAVRILNKLGYQHIEVAQNGLETLERLSKRFYEVILMDMQMPEMDGLEATKMIRLNEQQQPIIIAMTANAMQGDRDLCLQVGMNEYLTKPIKLEALMSALEKASESFRFVPGTTQDKS
jgi:CheY-like chemotaxis protein